MKSLSLPLSITKGRMTRQGDLKASIDSNVGMIISTARHTCTADPEYGFAFNNFRFNIFNENEGVIYNSMPEATLDSERRLYNLKLSGKSQNINTFAAELSAVISMYEPRLGDVKTTMAYIREQKKVFISVKGTISSSGEDYTFSTNIKAWN